MKRRFGGLVAAAASAMLASTAFAAPLQRSTDWTITLGVEGRVLPTYEGSDSFMATPIPLIDIRRASEPRRFRSPVDGASLGLYETGTFRFGPTAKVRLPRDESDDSDLRGLGDVDWTFEAGIFAEFWPTAWLRTRGELRRGFGGHEGWVSDLTADVVVPVTAQLTLSAGPRVKLADGDALNPYFGITPGQSIASGLAPYTAGGGVQSYGIGAQARYELTPHWATHVYMEYSQLAGDAADSPLVVMRGERDQMQVGIGVSYAFDIPGLW